MHRTIFIIILLLFYQLGHAAPCGPGERIMEALQFAKDFDGEGEIPKKLHLLMGRKGGEDFLDAARDFWKSGHPNEKSVAQLKEAARTGQVSAETIAEIRSLRARLKVLRFLCEAICDGHQAPKTLDESTKIIGKFQDAVAVKDSPEKIRSFAKKAYEALSAEQLEKLDKEIRAMTAADRKENERWLSGSLAEIQRATRTTSLTEKEFHGVRKILGRIQAIVLVDAALNGDPATARTLGTIRRLYDRIGDEHDSMIQAEHSGDHKKEIEFEEDVVRELDQVVRAIRKAHH